MGGTTALVLTPGCAGGDIVVANMMLTYQGILTDGAAVSMTPRRCHVVVLLLLAGISYSGPVAGITHGTQLRKECFRSKNRTLAGQCP
jgi:hypothetical protein